MSGNWWRAWLATRDGCVRAARFVGRTLAGLARGK